MRDISLAGLPKGVYGLQVRADVPIVAGAFVQRRTSPTAPGDLAWSSSTEAIAGVAGAPLPRRELGGRPLANRLALTSSGATANVEVVTTDSSGKATSRRLTLAADTATTVDLGDAASVWVHGLSGKGQLRAGAITTGSTPRAS